MLKRNYRNVIVGIVGLVVLLGAALLFLQSFPKTETVKRVVGQGLVAELSPEELFRSSTLVVEGTLEKKTEPFAVEGQNGEFQVYTDYFFRIRSLLRGTENQEVITVRRPGGVYENTEYMTEYDVDFGYDQNYLLCLYKVNYGGGTNTEGDYYAVNGVYQGIFEEIVPTALQGVPNSRSTDSEERWFANSWFFDQYQGSSDASSSSGFLFQEMANAVAEVENGAGYTNNLISMTSLNSYLRDLNAETPANENLSKEEILANFQANLDSGFMDREEYDFAVAALNQYGEIVSDYTILNRNGDVVE